MTNEETTLNELGIRATSGLWAENEGPMSKHQIVNRAQEARIRAFEGYHFHHMDLERYCKPAEWNRKVWSKKGPGHYVSPDRKVRAQKLLGGDWVLLNESDRSYYTLDTFTTLAEAKAALS